MPNYDLIKRFTEGDIKGKGSNLYIEGNNLVNYQTVIATRRGEVVILCNHNYSPTTGKNQSYVRNHSTKLIECDADMFESLLEDEDQMRQTLEAFEDIPGVSLMVIS